MYRKILQKAKLCSALLKDLILRCPRRTNLCLHFSRSQGLRTNTVPHGTDYSRGTSLTSLTFSCFVSRVRIRAKKTAPSWAPAWRDVMWRHVTWSDVTARRVETRSAENVEKSGEEKKIKKNIVLVSGSREHRHHHQQRRQCDDFNDTDNVDNATTSTTPTTSTPTPTRPHSTSCSRRKENLGQGQNRVSKERTKILIGCVFNWERNNPLWKKNLGRSFWGFQRTALIPSQALPVQNNDLHFNWNKSGPCLSR